MGLYDLTTLSACKLWLGFVGSDSDDAVNQQIGQISGMIMAWLNGPSFLKKARNEYYNGKGTKSLILRNFPVLSVSSLSVGGSLIPANPSPPNGAGYVLQPWDGDIPPPLQSIYLNNYAFYKGNQNINVQYVSGYVQTDSVAVPATPFQYTPLSPLGLCAGDGGVTYANGTALTAIAAGTPAMGQYVPPDPLNPKAPVPFYQFAAADAGVLVNVSYSYIPASVQMVATQLVGERISYRTRIGLKSKSLGGQETMSYDINTVPKWAQVALQPFTNIVPM